MRGTEENFQKTSNVSIEIWKDITSIKQEMDTIKKPLKKQKQNSWKLRPDFQNCKKISSRLKKIFQKEYREYERQARRSIQQFKSDLEDFFQRAENMQKRKLSKKQYNSIFQS